MSETNSNLVTDTKEERTDTPSESQDVLAPVKYPSGPIMVIIVIALMLSMFLVSPSHTLIDTNTELTLGFQVALDMASTRIMNNLQDTLLTLSQEYHLHCDPEDHDPVQEHGRYRMVRQFLLFDTCRFPIRLGSCIQELLSARLFSGGYWHIRDWKFGLRFGAKQ